MNATYAHMLPQLFARSAMGMRMGLQVTQDLLVALGSPDQTFDHIIVAGTNGKGSTSYLLSQALAEAGHNVGLFTSPHLCSYTERFRVNGVAIPAHTVVRLMAQLQEAETATGLKASFFEASTLLACLYFCERRVTLAVMECGLGGRLDATNALCTARRRMSIITPIDLDHQHILGADRCTIAREKAAVMRAGVPAVVAPQHDDVLAVLQAHAEALHTRLVVADPTHPGGERPRLPGYLDDNRRLVDTVRLELAHVGVPCPQTAMDLAVRTFAWPGRYQKLPSLRANGPSYLIDGSHNAAGMAALCRSLRQDSFIATKKLHAVFAVMPHKDEASLRHVLRQEVQHVHPCRIALASHNPHTEPCVLPSAAELLQHLGSTLTQNEVILVVGSLYLAGEALAFLCHLPADPPVQG